MNLDSLIKETLHVFKNLVVNGFSNNMIGDVYICIHVHGHGAVADNLYIDINLLSLW